MSWGKEVPLGFRAGWGWSENLQDGPAGNFRDACLSVCRARTFLCSGYIGNSTKRLQETARVWGFQSSQYFPEQYCSPQREQGHVLHAFQRRGVPRWIWKGHEQVFFARVFVSQSKGRVGWTVLFCKDWALPRFAARPFPNCRSLGNGLGRQVLHLCPGMSTRRNKREQGPNPQGALLSQISPVPGEPGQKHSPGSFRPILPWSSPQQSKRSILRERLLVGLEHRATRTFPQLFSVAKQQRKVHSKPLISRALVTTQLILDREIWDQNNPNETFDMHLFFGRVRKTSGYHRTQTFLVCFILLPSFKIQTLHG